MGNKNSKEFHENETIKDAVIHDPEANPEEQEESKVVEKTDLEKDVEEIPLEQVKKFVEEKKSEGEVIDESIIKNLEEGKEEAKSPVPQSPQQKGFFSYFFDKIRGTETKKSEKVETVEEQVEEKPEENPIVVDGKNLKIASKVETVVAYGANKNEIEIEDDPKLSEKLAEGSEKNQEKREIKEAKDPMNEAAKEFIKKCDTYELVETETRNILLMGRIRTGKSTFLELLKDPCVQPEQMSIFAQTKTAKFSSFIINDNRKGKVGKYTLNVVDTPGFYEKLEVGKQERSNEEIIHIISECLQREIKYINVVVAFITLENGFITSEDAGAIEQIVNLFGTTKTKIALCITHAEDYKPEKRKEIIKELVSDVRLHPFFASKKVFPLLFSGVIDLNTVIASYMSEKELFERYKKVYEYRKLILDFVSQSSTKYYLKDIQMVTFKVNEIRKFCDIVAENFKYFTKCQDYSGGECQQTIKDHLIKMKHLGRYISYIWSMNDESLRNAFEGVFAAAKDFFKNAKYQKKGELLRPIVFK